MDYIQIGSSGLSSSRIGLGTWAIGGIGWGGTDENKSIKTIQRAIDTGINLFDTAPIYGFGVAEEIVGKAVKQTGKRDNLLIATKAGMEWTEEGLAWTNASKRRIITELEDSLRRLQMDYIDIYQLHYPDRDTPIEEVADTFAQLHKEGKIRAIGVSNFTTEQIDQWRRIAPLHSSQTLLNVLQKEWIPSFQYCHENNLGSLTWGTLAQGLLTGKFNETSTFAEDDLRSVYPPFTGEYFTQHLTAVEQLKTMARELGKNVAQLSVRWVLDQPGVSVALWGARSEHQLDDIAGVFDWSLSIEDIERVNQIVKNAVPEPLVDSTPPPPTKKELQELGYLA
ncbi:aldo/keto reductase [Paenibacillus polymyxa]|uniref:aldo/keto reductase n=1 Tax=Paenibacillus polymyxa TaxID=1406 RepID=UPI00058A2CE7|nr:aldo/keto reductase [Paenibacillus polymyxa]AJE54263.1 general stress protein [Paenibacillus polymyxa]